MNRHWESQNGMRYPAWSKKAREQTYHSKRTPEIFFDDVTMPKAPKALTAAMHDHEAGRDDAAWDWLARGMPPAMRIATRRVTASMPTPDPACPITWMLAGRLIRFGSLPVGPGGHWEDLDAATLRRAFIEMAKIAPRGLPDHPCAIRFLLDTAHYAGDRTAGPHWQRLAEALTDHEITSLVIQTQPRHAYGEQHTRVAFALACAILGRRGLPPPAGLGIDDALHAAWDRRADILDLVDRGATVEARYVAAALLHGTPPPRSLTAIVGDADAAVRLLLVSVRDIKDHVFEHEAAGLRLAGDRDDVVAAVGTRLDAMTALEYSDERHIVAAYGMLARPARLTAAFARAFERLAELKHEYLSKEAGAIRDALGLHRPSMAIRVRDMLAKRTQDRHNHVEIGPDEQTRLALDIEQDAQVAAALRKAVRTRGTQPFSTAAWLLGMAMSASRGGIGPTLVSLVVEAFAQEHGGDYNRTGALVDVIGSLRRVGKAEGRAALDQVIAAMGLHGKDQAAVTLKKMASRERARRTTLRSDDGALSRLTPAEAQALASGYAPHAAGQTFRIIETIVVPDGSRRKLEELTAWDVAVDAEGRVGRQTGFRWPSLRRYGMPATLTAGEAAALRSRMDLAKRHPLVALRMKEAFDPLERDRQLVERLARQSVGYSAREDE